MKSWKSNIHPIVSGIVAFLMSVICGMVAFFFPNTVPAFVVFILVWMFALTFLVLLANWSTSLWRERVIRLERLMTGFTEADPKVKAENTGTRRV